MVVKKVFNYIAIVLWHVFVTIAFMNTLFPVEKVTPEGFEYTPDFISPAEEEDLLRVIKALELQTFTFQGYSAKRRVASFGHDWSFEKQRLSKGADIPPAFQPLLQKVAAHLHLKETDFAELLVTEYPEGSVINWHRDAPPFDLIAGISLLTDCTFRLRPHDKAKQSRSAIVSLPVARRSLYIIQGPSRSEWQHSITAVKHLRYSITLRTLRK
jgi:alkylated DNA repair dioxygenase AlkB